MAATQAATTVSQAGRQVVTFANFESIQLIDAPQPSPQPTPQRGYLNPNTTDDRAADDAGLSPQQRFVQALYLDALGRPGIVAELNVWVGVLNSVPNGQAAVARAIETSPEGRDNLVQGWYLTFLGRPAVGGEEAPHVNALLAGASEESVLSDILGGPEFHAHAQTLVSSGTPDERFVQALYQTLLGRTASPAELAGQVAGVNAGRAQVAMGFLQSAEFRTDLVEEYYRVLLHRDGSPGDVSGWVNSGLGLLDLRVAFESQPEFFANG
jgi:hypothetical protein